MHCWIYMIHAKTSQSLLSVSMTTSCNDFFSHADKLTSLHARAKIFHFETGQLRLIDWFFRSSLKKSSNCPRANGKKCAKMCFVYFVTRTTVKMCVEEKGGKSISCTKKCIQFTFLESVAPILLLTPDSKQLKMPSGRNVFVTHILYPTCETCEFADSQAASTRPEGWDALELALFVLCTLTIIDVAPTTFFYWMREEVLVDDSSKLIDISSAFPDRVIWPSRKHCTWRNAFRSDNVDRVKCLQLWAGREKIFIAQAQWQ